MTAGATLAAPDVAASRVTGTARRLSRSPAWLAGLARRNPAMTVLLAVGTLVRLVATIAYWPAFWFPDSYSYVLFARHPEVPITRPYGYSAFLIPAAALQQMWPVAVVQHLMGLGVGVAVYAFARHRGLPRWVSALLTAPLLLDSRGIVLEQYLLAETLFTALCVAGVMLLTWRNRPGLLACAAGGVLLASAAVTRTVGGPVLALPLLYLVLRRVGWLRLATVALAMAVPLGGYAVWFHHSTGEYGFTRFTGRFLWARTISFVDCRKLTLTGIQPQMCPKEPLGHRRDGAEYLWGRWEASRTHLGQQYDAQFTSFARKAILAQPGDYAHLVASDLWHMLNPTWHPNQLIACTYSNWQMTAPGDTSYCQPRISIENPLDPRWDPHPPSNGPGFRHSNLIRVLSWYGRLTSFPGWLIGLVFLVSIALALRRPLRPDSRSVLEPLLYSAFGGGMIVLAVATSAIDPRYMTPAQPFAMLGLLLAIGRVRAAGTRSLSVPPIPAPPPVPSLEVTGAGTTGSGATGSGATGEDDRAAGTVV
jgi:hypothetical protein